MYELGDRTAAIKLIKSILRKQPGYADLHVALAADAWDRPYCLLPLTHAR